MNILVLSLELYNKVYLYFLEKKTNHVINGVFTKIIYTHPHYTMNGLFLYLSLKNTVIEYLDKYKTVLKFDPSDNNETIRRMKQMENDIIVQYCKRNDINKNIELCLYDHLKQGKVRIYDTQKTSSSQYIVKISGIWESDTTCGLTYKIMESTSEQ